MKNWYINQETSLIGYQNLVFSLLKESFLLVEKIIGFTKKIDSQLLEANLQFICTFIRDFILKIILIDLEKRII